MTGEDPWPEFSESSDSEAMGECCEGLEGTVSGMESESCSQESDGGESYSGISDENVVEMCSTEETDTETESDEARSDLGDVIECSSSSAEEFETEVSDSDVCIVVQVREEEVSGVGLVELGVGLVELQQEDQEEVVQEASS